MSTGFLQRFYSAFPGGEMTLSPGGGTATETGGILTLATGSGVHCEAPANNPIATAVLHDRMAAFDSVCKVEGRCYSMTGSSVAMMGLQLMLDRNNGYRIGWYSTNGSIYVEKWTAGSYVTLVYGAVVANPATSPHTYRIYWNPSQRRTVVSEADGSVFSIGAGEVQICYRIGDAGAWVVYHTRQMEWPLGAFSGGLFNGNYGTTWHATTALFNYFGLYQWDAAAQHFVPSTDEAPLVEMPPDPEDLLLLEDALQLSSQSGTPIPDGSVDAFNNPAVINEQEPRVALEDDYQVLKQGGQPFEFFGPAAGDQGVSLPTPASFERLSLEDDLTYYLMCLAPAFSTATQDSDLHYHFAYLKPYLAHYYDGTLDAWNTPTLNNFTGYARNGYKYTNGVQDSGPVSAPWRSEASGANRSSRGDFPVKVLIVVTQRELVIFDLDTYTSGSPSTLRVWMRFLLANDASNFYALGRGIESIRSVAYVNGLLAVGTTTNAWEAGGLLTIDFKATTSPATYSLIRSDGQWVGVTAKTIVDRNATNCYTASGSYRIDPESVHSLAIFAEGTNTHYVVLAGEDPSPQLVKLTGNAVQSVVTASGDDIGAGNAGDYRKVLFDDVGWLWFSVGTVLYRNCRDWREGFMLPQKNDTRQGVVDIGEQITHLVHAKDSIYVGTASGVYRVHKGSMRAYLAYTIANGGGRGRLNVAHAGELIAGTRAAIQSLKTYTLLSGTTVVPYLAVGTMFDTTEMGAYTLIRLWDDIVVRSFLAPDIIDPGTYISSTLLA